MQKLISGVFIFLFSTVSLWAAPTVNSHTPTKNKLNVSKSSDITVTFSDSMNISTLTSSNIKVFGSISGFHAGSIQYNIGSRTLTFNPTNDFLVGETVTTVLTTGIQNYLNEPMSAQMSWKFTVSVSASNGTLNSSVTDYTTGSNPISTATADVDGTNGLDILVANASSSSVSVFLNQGDGTFASKVDYSTATGPNPVMVADFNNDGKIDFATTNSSTSNISVLINNGDGTFATKVDYATDTNPDNLATGDVDGDGDIDLVSSNSGSTTVSVLKNNGNGTFAAKVDYPVSYNPHSVTIGDVDNDGDADLLVLTWNNGALKVLMNNGNGTFASAVDYTTVVTPRNLTTADLDNDGFLDVITANGFGNSISFFKNNGDGTFASKVDYAVGSNAFNVTAFDVEGDGDLDVAVPSANDGYISVFKNNGSGSLSGKTDYTSSGSVSLGTNAADLDNDGDLDLIHVNQFSNTLSVRFSVGLAPKVSSVSPTQNATNVLPGTSISATFDKQVASGLSSSSIVVRGSQTGVHAGDFSYDSGTLTASFNPTNDFVAGELVTVTVKSGIAGNLTATSDKGFSWSFTIRTDTGSVNYRTDKYAGGDADPKGVAVADFNGDGIYDLAATTSEYNDGSYFYVSIFNGNNKGGYADKVSYSVAAGPSGLTAVDVNNDGHPDLVAANYTYSGSISVLINNGDGTFASNVTYPTSLYPEKITHADVDGDGDEDIIVNNAADNSLSVLKNDGTGNFSNRADIGMGTSVYEVSPADIDNDGDFDLVLSLYSSNKVTVLKNDGLGSYSSAGNYTTPSGPYDVTVADINGDGYVDMMSANQSSTNMSVFINNGDGTFAAKVDYTIGTVPDVIAAGDFDGDGYIDAVIANRTTNKLSIFYNNGDGTFADIVDLASGSSITDVIFSDVDGNGTLDIVMADKGSDNVSIIKHFPVPPAVVSVTPTRNLLNVSPSASITVTFDKTVTSSTLNSNTILVNGSISGKHTGTISYDSGSKTATFNPTNDFRYGEVVTVNLTTQIKGILASALEKQYSWNFTVKADTAYVYNSKLDFTTAANPSGVGAADFDGDGRLDVAVVNNPSNTFSIFIAKDDTSFETKVDYSVASDPWFLTTGDLNGDGWNDIVVASNGTHKLSVLLNNGDGTFAAKVDYSTAFNPHIGYPADLDGDGDLDLVSSNYSSASVSVLMNNGDGTFAAKQDYGTGSNPYHVAVGDVNADGWLDLVIPNSNSSSVTVLKNNSDGTFGGRIDYTTGTNPSYAIVNDLNGDEKMDIAVVNYGSQSLSVLLNTSNTSFASKVDYTVGTNPFVLNTADTDGDGDLDLLATNISSNDLSLLKNNGDGTFASQISIKTGSSPRGSAIADMDNDGDMDIIATSSGSNKFSIYNNAQIPPTVSSVSPSENQLNVNRNSSITFTFDIAMMSSTISANTVKVFGSKKGFYSGNVTFNTNTKTGTFDPTNDFEVGELITVTVTPGVKSAEDSKLLYAYSWNFTTKVDGKPSLDKKVDFNVGSSPLGVISADIDNDGDMDMVVGNSGTTTISVLKNAGDTTFAEKVNYTVANDTWGVSSADLNGDGFMDLISTSNGASKVSVLMNDQNGSFLTKVDYATAANPHVALTLDIDGDGDIDLVTSNWSSHSISVLMNKGDGTFETKVDYGTGANPWEIQASDIDNDGDIDIISSNTSAASVSVLKNNGDGTFATKVDYTSGANPWGLAVSDINGDGHSDILVTSNSTNSFSVLMNNQDGTFADKVDYSTSTNPFGITTADLDGDGDLEVMVANYGSTVLSVFKNVGDGAFSAKEDLEIGTQPSFVTTSDIDGDLDLDIIVTNRGSSTVSIFKTTPTPPQVSSVTPGLNALNVSRSSAITVTFDQSMKVSSLNTNSIVVSGSMTGMYNGNVTYNDETHTVTYTPTKNFKPGEKINVSVTSNTESSIGSHLVKTYHWDFIAKAETGGSFGKPTYLPINDYAETLKLADMDGDNHVDFLFSEWSNDSVSVIYNNGNGTYSPVKGFAFANPRIIVAEDLNNDMQNDIIGGTTDINSNISVMKNLGNRNYASRVTYSVSADYGSVATTDVDGDGFKDIIVNNEYQNKVSILKNNGNGTFAPKVNYSTSTVSNSFTDRRVNSADMDGDGDMDVITTDNGGDTLTILFNNGKGVFSEKSHISLGLEEGHNTYYDFVTTDIDGDGDVDIMVPLANYNAITVLKNNGDGTFAARVDYEVAPYSVNVIASDLDGDGDLDLVSNDWDNYNLSLLINNGDGTFEPSKVLNLGYYAMSIASADMNGDGKMDIAAITLEDETYRIYVYLNNSASNPTGGTFSNVSIDSSKTLTSNLSVSGTLTVGAQITTGNNTIDLGSTGNISGETPSNYIVGKVQTTRDISTSQSNIGGMGISIDPQSNNLGSTLIRRETGTAVGENGIKQKWTITPTTQPTGPVTVTLSWPSTNDNSINLSDLVVYKSEDSGETWNVIAATINKDSDPRTATFTISSFSQFTIGESANLPVELASFTGYESNGKVVLNWETKTESNNLGWEIEQRSLKQGSEEKTNNSHAEPVEAWTKLGFVDGKGTTTEKQNYSYTVSNVLGSKAEYRLKQVDTDGKFEYSNILTIELKPTEFSLAQNYPNPFNPTTTIKYALAAPVKVELTVYNILGQKVKTLVNDVQEIGFYAVTLNASDLTSGTYFYVLNAGEFKSTKKLVLLK